VPARQRPRLPSPHNAAPPPNARRRNATIENDRNRLYAELTKLRIEHGPSVRPAKNGQDLLTRSWGRASWKSREQLLKTAEWLIRLLERNRRIPIA
jgi:hypothetical protein